MAAERSLRRRMLTGLGAAAASLAIHAALLWGLAVSLAPERVRFRPEQAARFSIEALDAPAERASPTPPEADRALEGRAAVASGGLVAPPRERAAPADAVPEAAALVPSGDAADRVAAEALRPEPLAPADADTAQARPVAPSRPAATAAAPPAARMTARPAEAARAHPVQPPSGRAAPVSAPQGDALSAAAAPPDTPAAAAPPDAPAAAAVPPEPAPTAPSPAMGETAPARSAEAAPAAAALTRGERRPSVAAGAQPIAAQEAAGRDLGAVALASLAATTPAAPPASRRAEASTPEPAGLAVVPARASPARTADPEATPAPIRPPATTAAAPLQLAAFAAPAQPAAPEASGVRAATGWTGAADGTLDPQSAAAVAAFMAPAAADAGPTVRDGLHAALSTVPCSRLAAAFDPEAGAIALRGHVRDAALAETAIDTVGSAVGASIPVEPDLLVLPEPQCSALDAVAALGLPQSNAQADDPLTVGQAAAAELIRLEEGEPMVFGLVGADYPAYLFVSGFDSGGTVTHLHPNAFSPLQRRSVKEAFSIGGGEADGSGVELRVVPPFGTTIIVVIATTEPLFEDIRPLREDAGGYLDAVSARIAALRAADPTFRGEWVYMTLETYAAGSRPAALAPLRRAR